MATERTPLLPTSIVRPAPQAGDISATGTFLTPLDDDATSSSRPLAKKKRRWPKVIGILLLLLFIAAAIVAGFLAPAAAETYAREAVTLKISSVAVDSFTQDGLQARVRATVNVDAARVENRYIRTLGRLSTRIARRVETTDNGKLQVFLPEYGNALLGNASIPPLVIDIEDGHSTPIDFVSDVRPGSLESARQLLDGYVNGSLKSVKILGEARLDLKTGYLPLGNQLLSETLKFSRKQFPSMPKLNVTHLNFSQDDDSVKVKVHATVPNPYPVQFELPLLDFSVWLPSCDEELVKLATAVTPKLLIQPKADINFNISGLINSIPDTLTEVCPGSDRSPMDNFLESYLHGNFSTVFVSGSGTGYEAPDWLLDFLKSVTLPVPFPGHEFHDLVEAFGLSHVSFKLPDRGAEPGSPEASPKLSAVVDATVIMPPEMNFSLDVNSVRANANLSYHGDKFGEVHITDWMPAKSYPTSDGKLKVRADVIQAPLKVTDYEVFQKVVQRLAWGGGRGLILEIDGFADVQMSTTLGEFAVRGIPTTGDVTIKGFPNISDLSPKATGMEVLDTTESSMTIQIGLDVFNPTDYEADIPYMNVLIMNDRFVLGNVSIVDTVIRPGNNSFELVTYYDPLVNGGSEEAVEKGLEMLGDYVSGKNTSITIRPHLHSIPALPELSKALSDFLITLPMPRLGRSRPPSSPSSTSPPPSSIGHHRNDDGGDDDDEDTDSDDTQHFLSGATMHIFSSSATFLLHNPFPKTPISILSINGTASYNGTKLGSVYYDTPWKIEQGSKGESVSPRLPVEWRLGSAAYAAMVDALGGVLRIDALAEAWVGVGRWGGRIAFDGAGVKAGVRL